jgi:hypothetical protein
VAVGSDDWIIEGTVGLVVFPQERIDLVPQLRIGCTLTLQKGGARRGLVAFNCRQEQGLNTLWIDRHQMVLGSGLHFGAA